ncbi:hypothetical protein ACLOJK_039819 [Asimina triloba]
MAVEAGAEEADYESDPEESVLPLAMRRREASDDEEEGDDEGGGRESRSLPRAGIASDGESDGQGGAPAYDDEESEIDDDEEEIEEEGEEAEEVGIEEEQVEEEFENMEVAAAAESGGQAAAVASGGKSRGVEEEKRESEPFAVPTAGAFYMHDDRFRDNGGGRHRRTPGGRKLWESKDNREWVHDRFEELNLQDSRYEEERRRSKGHFRGRGRYRGTDRGYVRGNRSRVYDDNNIQNRDQRTVRGRGPRRYEPHWKGNYTALVSQNKQSGKPLESTSNANSGRLSTHSSNSQPESFAPQKHVFASSLSSASPPFYPSGTSTQDVSTIQKRDAHTGGVNRNLQPSVAIEENFSASHSSTLMRGKAVVDSASQDRHFSGDSVRAVGGKPLNNLQHSSGLSSPVNTMQLPQSKVQGRGLAVSGQLNHQPGSSPNQLTRALGQMQLPAAHQRPVQNLSQAVLQASSQQTGQCSGTRASSPPPAPSMNPVDVGEMELLQGSNKSKSALVGKGKASIQGSGRGSFLYSGAQVIGATGAMGVAHGDQNFPGTPALLPVMQFGGQHNGGIGVPAVGMALPGYETKFHIIVNVDKNSEVPVGTFGSKFQFNLTLNSEVPFNLTLKWAGPKEWAVMAYRCRHLGVPVLAGAAGALGATYCPPYIAVDGGYYGRPSGQTSLSTSKEAGTNKANNVSKLPQRPEIVNNEFGQRQNKPRRPTSRALCDLSFCSGALWVAYTPRYARYGLICETSW